MLLSPRHSKKVNLDAAMWAGHGGFLPWGEREQESPMPGGHNSPTPGSLHQHNPTAPSKGSPPAPEHAEPSQRAWKGLLHSTGKLQPGCRPSRLT